MDATGICRLRREIEQYVAEIRGGEKGKTERRRRGRERHRLGVPLGLWEERGKVENGAVSFLQRRRGTGWR
jgi:hypothetical protein